MISAKLLGYIQLDAGKLAAEIECIRNRMIDSSYKEYACGNWGTVTLWNHSGSDNDQLSREHINEVKATDFGLKLSYINELIKKNFNVSLIKSVRVFRSWQGGAIYPHIDYLEFDKGFKRIHLVLNTDESCLNSEDDVVYHMRQGEVWFVDGNVVHSAMSLSQSGKLSLVIDFDASASFSDIYNIDNDVRMHSLKPHILTQRPLFPDTLRQSFINIASHAEIYDFHPILYLATRYYFTWQMSCVEYFNLLDEAFGENQNVALKDKYKMLKNILVESGYLESVVKQYRSIDKDIIIQHQRA
jgi:hypothetical protein